MVRRAVTSDQIQRFVQRHHGFIPTTDWIDHVKVRWGLSRPGRIRRVVPCPPDKREAIEQALRHFGVI
jgi:hypothetical protein